MPFSPRVKLCSVLLVIASFAPGANAARLDHPKHPLHRLVELRASLARQPQVTTVSAASYGVEVAPGEIVAAFGVRLATQTVIATDADPITPGIQLPTELGGTTVEVNGRRAGLFFVSPTQINYLMPPATETGQANVVVRAGDGAISTGTAQINAAAPAIFTANSSGTGLPAGTVLRVLPTGAQIEEPLGQFDPATGAFTARPINLSAPGERVFLILYLTGLGRAVDANGDGNFNEAVHVLLGGNEITPDYAGAQGTFAGLDQINIEIPRSMIGRGAVNLAVNYSTLFASNITRIEIAGTSPVSVSGFTPATATAGGEITINGAGFAANAADNQVFLVDAQEQPFRAKVIAASPTQLRALAPFGAGSGRMLVRTPAGEAMSTAILTLRTSISGVVTDDNLRPLPGVVVRLLGANLSAMTSAEGVLLIAGAPANTASQPGSQIEVDATGLVAAQPFPKVTLSLPVRAGRDNPFPNFIALQRGATATLSETNAESDSQSSDLRLGTEPAQQRTTITGLVVESDGTTPAPRALVVANGRATFSDNTGRYVLADLAGAMATLDAAALRPDGRVDRAGNRIASLPLAGGVSIAPSLILQAATANRPPVLIAPKSLLVNQGETRGFNFIASDPDAGQTVQVTVSGAPFASVSAAGGFNYALRFVTGVTDGGPYTLTLTARDSQNLVTTETISLRVNRPPTATAQTTITIETIAKTVTLTGSDPDGDALTFSIVTPPARGKLTAATGANVTYIPPLNFTGADSFMFKASDGALESSPATVTINVAAISEARRFASLSTGVSVLMPSAADLAANVSPLSAGVSVLLPPTSDAATKIAPLSAGVSVQFNSATNVAASVAPLSAGVSVQFALSASAASQAAPLSAGVTVEFPAPASAAATVAPLSAGVSVQLPNAGSAANLAPLSPGVSVQASPSNVSPSRNRKSPSAPRSKPPP